MSDSPSVADRYAGPAFTRVGRIPLLCGWCQRKRMDQPQTLAIGYADGRAENLRRDRDPGSPTGRRTYGAAGWPAVQRLRRCSNSRCKAAPVVAVGHLARAVRLAIDSRWEHLLVDIDGTLRGPTGQPIVAAMGDAGSAQ